MPTTTVHVDDDLKDRMENHPEINWAAVSRQAIEVKIDELELMDELTSGSDLSESDVQEIADRMSECGRERVHKESR